MDAHGPGYRWRRGIHGEDLCAETPVTESADSNGCSASQKDTDGDGIATQTYEDMTIAPMRTVTESRTGATPS